MAALSVYALVVRNSQQKHAVNIIKYSFYYSMCTSGTLLWF